MLLRKEKKGIEFTRELWVWCIFWVWICLESKSVRPMLGFAIKKKKEKKSLFWATKLLSFGFFPGIFPSRYVFIFLFIFLHFLLSIVFFAHQMYFHSFCSLSYCENLKFRSCSLLLSHLFASYSLILVMPLSPILISLKRVCAF